MERVLVGSYAFQKDGERVTGYNIEIKPDAYALSMGVPENLRGLILRRITGPELLEMRESHSGFVSASGADSVTINMDCPERVTGVARTTEESYLALVQAVAPFLMRAGEEAVAGVYDSAAMEARGRRLAEIGGEITHLANLSKTTENAEEARNADLGLAELFIERRQIYDQMITDVEAAIPSYTGNDRAKLEAFRDALKANAGMGLEELQAYRDDIQNQSYYNYASMMSLWNELGEIHTKFLELRTAFYASQSGEERTSLTDQGWQLLIRRKEIYDEMLRQTESATVFRQSEVDAITGLRQDIVTNMQTYYVDVDFDALRAQFGGVI
ncbi:hypothetical protein H0O01_04340 [Candidatus Micrarchaeota archaeon]|nr:hypothetical protein [Candidatus Micrarchaeota archaeon]